MRTVVLLLAALALAPLATAQMNPLTQPYQVRAAVGDILTAQDHTGLGANDLNVEQRLTTDATKEVRLHLPAGATLVRASCTCGATGTPAGSDVVFNATATASGTYTVVSRQAAGQSASFYLVRPDAARSLETVLVVFTATNEAVEGPVADSGPGTSTDGTQSIHEFAGVTGDLWATIHPAASTAAAPASTGIPWAWAIGGIVLGALVWSVLVSKGMVQARSRRQVVAAAAHVEAAKAEPAPVLEARKRALMAALKEIEVAKQAQELEPDVYDTVKADFKKQTVTVMRALETAGKDA